MFTRKHLIFGLAGMLWLAFGGAGFAVTPTPIMLKKCQELFNENSAV